MPTFGKDLFIQGAEICVVGTVLSSGEIKQGTAYGSSEEDRKHYTKVDVERCVDVVGTEKVLHLAATEKGRLLDMS